MWGVCGIIYIVKKVIIFERLVFVMEDKMVRIAVKEPNKDVKIVEVKKGYRSKTLKPFIPSTDYSLQYVVCGDDALLTMGVDEDGLLKNLETNFYIESNHFACEKIVGSVVFSRVEYVNVFEQEVYDYVLDDLTDEDIKYINMMLDEDYQKDLKKLFEEKGSRWAIKFDTYKYL